MTTAPEETTETLQAVLDALDRIEALAEKVKDAMADLERRVDELENGVSVLERQGESIV